MEGEKWKERAREKERVGIMYRVFFFFFGSDFKMICLTNDEVVAIELVLWNLEVKRSRALSDSARNVIVRTVAWAEPAAKIASLTNRDTTQVGANTQHDEPRGVLDTISVGLGISEGSNVDSVGLSNLVGSAVTNEHGLTTPLDNDVAALRDGGKVDLDLGQGKNVSRSRHGRKEVLNGGLGGGSRDHAKGANNEVGKGTVGVGVSVLSQVIRVVGDIVCRATNGVTVVETLLGKSYKKNKLV